ncbi:hypothetical protein ACIQLJ_14610 [Microbacterium sp. NPDC091313]
MSTRSARAARGAVFAALASATAATAHTLAGGGAPSPLFCLLLAVLALPVTTALAGTRTALWRTAGAVGAAQLLFHAAFASVGDIGAWGAVASHTHGNHVLAPPMDDATVMPTTWAMTLAHAVAALIVIAAVHRGERVARAIAAWLPRLVRRLRTAVLPARPRPVPSIPAHPHVARGLRLLASSLRRRGPPSPLVALRPAS